MEGYSWYWTWSETGEKIRYRNAESAEDAAREHAKDMGLGLDAPVRVLHEEGGVLHTYEVGLVK